MDSDERKSALRRCERLRDRTARAILTPRVPLAASFSPAPDPLTFAAREAGLPLAVGESWGRNWETAWIRLEGRVPAEWKGRKVTARIDVGGEGLVHDGRGTILQGVSAGSVWAADYKRERVHLLESAQGGEEIDLWIAASANALFGLAADPDPEEDAPDRHGTHDARLGVCEIGCFDEEAWGLWNDLVLLIGLLRGLDESSFRRARLLAAGMECCDAAARGGEPAPCRSILARELGSAGGGTRLEATAVGHAHIDVAWLWPVEETMRKCARTFASQIALIRRYPGYVFGASQAQLYAWTKELYPDLYAGIREAVRAGRWEVQGGMWVEADCNLTGGESLVRQILHGKDFFREEFGVDIDTLWLPDVFGYSAALPQILRKSGIRFFLTQKLSWNQTNEFPHHTFLWEGIDGSRVLSHFPPENTYNSLLDPADLIRAGERFREKEEDGFLCLFGVGDGGGGPKEEQCELGLRLADVEGAPRLRFGSSREFFHKQERAWDRLPVWSGELYLELHRGTLTTQAWTKRLNRLAEGQLRTAEMLWSALPLDSYPAKFFDGIWKTVLTNQFHDILPGSSIASVYERTTEELGEVLLGCMALADRAVVRLAPADDHAMVLFNPATADYDGPVEVPGHPTLAFAAFTDAEGNPVPSQREEAGLVLRARIPALGFAHLRANGPSGRRPRKVEPLAPAPDGRLVLENDRIRYELSPEGLLLRGYDKEEDREVLNAGQPGNVLALYDDRPNDWDAWDIDLAYEKGRKATARAESWSGLPAGPVRRGFEFSGRIGRSEWSQSVSLAEGSKRLDFRTTILWRERHAMLRVSFPLAVRAEQASFDVQFGYVRRPTHRNTSWDRARFEVAAHRYADLSEPDYGVALLNDCKYGHKVLGHTLDLCLLRAPTSPDPGADQEDHVFTYALLPHAGDLVRSDVMDQAAWLNTPPLAFPGRGPATPLPFRLSGPGLDLAAAKKGEREDCLILRLVERHGAHSRGVLAIDPRARICPTDLMEREDGPGCEHDGSVPLVLDPFEIRTYKVFPPERSGAGTPA